MAHSRRGVHGMVLFGSERTLLSHIPMFDEPHDFQVVLEVSIGAGVPEDARNFGRKLFTVKPEVFSLYDLAHGDLASFRGTIFEGNFESPEGRAVFRNVRFDVKRILLERPLSRSTPVSPSLDYLAVGTPTDAYLVHVIDGPTSFDQVLAIDLPAPAGLQRGELEGGVMVRVSGGVNEERARVKPREVEDAEVQLVIAGDAGDAGDQREGGLATPARAPAAAVARVELSCLRATDFVEACE